MFNFLKKPLSLCNKTTLENGIVFLKSAIRSENDIYLLESLINQMEDFSKHLNTIEDGKSVVLLPSDGQRLKVYRSAGRLKVEEISTFYHE